MLNQLFLPPWSFLHKQKSKSMASLRYFHQFAALLPSLVLAIFFSTISLPSFTFSQVPSPSIAQCAPQLLPLASCAPFVQGTAQSPTVPCCNNLRQIYNQQPKCLCLLLNDTTLSSFPINSTLALQLPLLCSLQADMSTCSGVSVPPPPTSPGSQVSLGTNPNTTTGSNATVAASPTFQTAPRPSIMGLGFGNSASNKPKTGGGYIVVMIAIMMASLLKELL